MTAARKILVVGILALLVPSWCGALVPARIAWVWPGDAVAATASLSALKDGMRENGILEGKHYVLDERYADGHYDRFPALIDELLKHNPSILMVVTIESVRAAQRATKTVPIIFASTNDPVGSAARTR